MFIIIRYVLLTDLVNELTNIDCCMIGTWPGAPSESWNEKLSTFRQVLLSIQSLIFVPQPYFNEPSYESTIGTPAGTSASKSYNQTIRNATIRWAMIDHLENPKKGFEDVSTVNILYCVVRLLSIVHLLCYVLISFH